MMQLHKIEDSRGIDLNKSDKSKECKIFHYNNFYKGFKSHSEICNGCEWGTKPFGNFAIVTANGVSYIFFMFDMTEEDVIEVIKDFEPEKLQKCYSTKKVIF